jgi:hypothetical protein
MTSTEPTAPPYADLPLDIVKALESHATAARTLTIVLLVSLWFPIAMPVVSIISLVFAIKASRLKRSSPELTAANTPLPGLTRKKLKALRPEEKNMGLVHQFRQAATAYWVIFLVPIAYIAFIVGAIAWLSAG